jgi:hypothetical protein
MGQLAILPMRDGRGVERRVVNLAARLREPGATLVDAELRDLSTEGFMAETSLALELGMTVWLKLEGLAPFNCAVAWVKEGKGGFKFAIPLDVATVETVIAAGRKPMRKGHFGRQY